MILGIGIGIGIGIVFFVCGLVFYTNHKREKYGVQIEMIRARLMLLSTYPTDIQAFLENKEPYLTQEMIDQLINRVAELKADETIDKNWNAKLSNIRHGILPLSNDEIVEIREIKQVEKT